MILVACPLCETAAVFVPDGAAVECAPCGVRLELAEDEPVPAVALPLAA